MLAARLHGVGDLRVDQVDHPGPPAPGDVLLRVTAVGLCGSDLNLYRRGGDGIDPHAPLIPGHEFAGRVEQAGPDSRGGDGRLLAPGMRVAVDPGISCGQCELCQRGHPNLCERLRFCGQYPDPGALREFMHMPARNCHSLPDEIDDARGALLETLGVAIHAVDLAKVRVGDSAAVLGAGPIGLCIARVLAGAGAGPVFVTDPLPWRLERAECFGAVAIRCAPADTVRAVHERTGGRGVDIAMEAAWADESVQQAAEMARLGGRLVLVGIPGDDRLALRHSTARRKGLTIRMARRMKHTYPRALRLVQSGAIDLSDLVTHRFSLDRAPEAFALNAAYQDRVLKLIIGV